MRCWRAIASGADAPNPPVILITDWREVPTWSEFQILRERFGKRGVTAIVADPRDLTFEGGKLIAEGQAIDLVYRRVLIADIIAREAECRTLLDAYEQRAVCMANTLQCKIPHKKAFFAVLTDDTHASRLFSASERALIAQHVPWTRVLAEGRTSRGGEEIDLLPHVRAWREDLVIKPNDEYGGSGVVLGWEADAKTWDDAIENAVGGNDGAWIVQARIPVRREVFPAVTAPGQVEMRDMLVDFAPYLFRGKLAGFLTRLSATGLANVTSGGGQVPAFVVSRKRSESRARTLTPAPLPGPRERGLHFWGARPRMITTRASTPPAPIAWIVRAARRSAQRAPGERAARRSW